MNERVERARKVAEEYWSTLRYVCSDVIVDALIDAEAQGTREAFNLTDGEWEQMRESVALSIRAADSDCYSKADAAMVGMGFRR